MTEGRRAFRENDTCALRKKLYREGWLKDNPLRLKPPADKETAGYRNKLTATLLSPPGYAITPKYVLSEKKAVY